MWSGTTNLQINEESSSIAHLASAEISTENRDGSLNHIPIGTGVDGAMNCNQVNIHAENGFEPDHGRLSAILLLNLMSKLTSKSYTRIFVRRPRFHT